MFGKGEIITREKKSLKGIRLKKNHKNEARTSSYRFTPELDLFGLLLHFHGVRNF